MSASPAQASGQEVLALPQDPAEPEAQPLLEVELPGPEALPGPGLEGQQRELEAAAPG